MSNTQTISATRALAELKLLDSRIEKGINSAQFANHSVGSKTITGFKSNDEFCEKAKSSFQSVQDLIGRRNAIKSALVVSNATTKIEVGEYEYTVAEAIERKSSIVYDKHLLNKMKRDYAHAVSSVDTINHEVKIRWDKLLEVQFGNESKKNNPDSELLAKTFMDSNEAKLIDPLDLKVQIEKLEAEIDEFESEVDSALTESNAVTKIEIPL